MRGSASSSRRAKRVPLRRSGGSTGGAGDEDRVGSAADVLKAIGLLAVTAGAVLALSVCMLSVILALGNRFQKARRRSA